MDPPQRLRSLAMISVGGTLVVIGAFLPWLQSGARTRSSFEMFAVIDRLEFAPDGIAGTGLRWWPLVPAVLLVGLALVWWQLPRLGAALSAAAGLYAGAVVLAVALAPVPTEVGVMVTLVGVVVLLPAAAVLSWPTRH